MVPGRGVPFAPKKELLLAAPDGALAEAWVADSLGPSLFRVGCPRCLADWLSASAPIKRFLAWIQFLEEEGKLREEAEEMDDSEPPTLNVNSISEQNS